MSIQLEQGAETESQQSGDQSGGDTAGQSTEEARNQPSGDRGQNTDDNGQNGGTSGSGTSGDDNHVGGSSHDAGHGDDHSGVAHHMAHVQDSYYFEVPRFFASHPEELPSYLKHAEPGELHGKLLIPQPFGTLEDLHKKESGFLISKFMVVQVVVALLLIVVFIRLAGKIKSGEPVKGRLANLLEAMLLFIRDNVARPAIGAHDADRFLPFLWTLFFFIVSCNVIGMVPWVGTATGALGVTAVLAASTFLVVIFSGMFKLGAVGFWKAQVPHMDLSPALALGLKPMIFAIEVGGLFIKHTVLAVRLLANMFAGHLVLAVILGFIAQTAESGLWYGVMPASVLGSAALGLLELFVAFLQAYIFTFLTSLFIGMAVHPH